MMKIIGLTGTVGSGKSTVGKIIEENFSAKVAITDEMGHFVMKKGTPGYKQILKEFGTDILDSLKEIDRRKLGEIVFSDVEKLEKLNGIIHPRVKEYLVNDINKEKKLGNIQYYIIESAILFETELNVICQENWYVDTEHEIRRDRLKRSRGYSDERIEAILSNQKGREYFIERCNYIIENNEALDSVMEQLKKLLV